MMSHIQPMINQSRTLIYTLSVVLVLISCTGIQNSIPKFELGPYEGILAFDCERNCPECINLDCTLVNHGKSPVKKESLLAVSYSAHRRELKRTIIPKRAIQPGESTLQYLEVGKEAEFVTIVSAIRE
jgi:hypothetical protein